MSIVVLWTRWTVLCGHSILIANLDMCGGLGTENWNREREEVEQLMCTLSISVSILQLPQIKVHVL